jgi:hypothetical protein
MHVRSNVLLIMLQTPIPVTRPYRCSKNFSYLSIKRLLPYT